MRYRFWTLLGVLLLGLFGCGGGGTGGGGTKPVIVNIPPGTATNGNIGSAIVKFTALNFPSGGKVVLTTTNPSGIAQPKHRSLQSQLTLDCSPAPVGPFTIEYPDTSGGMRLVAIAFDGSQAVGAFPVERVNGKIIVTVDPSLNDRTRNSGLVISLVVGLATLMSPPDSEPGLTQVGPNNAGRVAIFVHGLMQSADDSIPALQRLRSIGGYGSCWSVRYRYDDRFIDVAGRQLAEIIRNAGFAPKSVDLYGYSKGGLVVATALQMEDETMAVDRAVFLGTPFKGCRKTLAGIYWMLGGLFANMTSPMSFIDWPDNSLDELMPGSQSLTTLNQYRYKQNGRVEYYFFPGGSDNVVSEDSAEANGLPIGDATNGSIHRHTLNGRGHFDLDDPDVVEEAYRAMTNVQGGISITFDQSEPLQPDWSTGSWRVATTYTNNTGQPVTYRTDQYEEFNRPAVWQGNYWYDRSYPPGVFFPHERVEWNERVASGDSRTLYIEYWPNENATPVWNAPYDQQARTSHIILLAEGDNGVEYRAERILHMAYGTTTPIEPNPRRPHQTVSRPSSIGVYKK